MMMTGEKIDWEIGIELSCVEKRDSVGLILRRGEEAFRDDRGGCRGWDGDRGAVQEDVIGWNGRLLGGSPDRGGE